MFQGRSLWPSIKGTSERTWRTVSNLSLGDVRCAVSPSAGLGPTLPTQLPIDSMITLAVQTPLWPPHCNAITTVNIKPSINVIRFLPNVSLSRVTSRWYDLGSFQGETNAILNNFTLLLPPLGTGSVTNRRIAVNNRSGASFYSRKINIFFHFDRSIRREGIVLLRIVSRGIKKQTNRARVYEKSSKSLKLPYNPVLINFASLQLPPNSPSTPLPEMSARLKLHRSRDSVIRDTFYS